MSLTSLNDEGRDEIVDKIPSSDSPQYPVMTRFDEPDFDSILAHKMVQLIVLDMLVNIIIIDERLNKIAETLNLRYDKTDMSEEAIEKIKEHLQLRDEILEEVSNLL